MRWFLLVSLLLLFSSPSWAQSPASLTTALDLNVGDFTLTERSGKKFRPDELRGKVWVAHFFFTTCTQGCQQTTQTMKQLQEIFRGRPDVRLVSISVHPEKDSREVLESFAHELQAEPGQWFFLTGEGDEDPRAVVQKHFFQAALPSDSKEAGKEVIHSFALKVIDRQGNIAGYVDGRDPTVVGELVERVRNVAAQRYRLPAFNAILNSLCTVLLILGYIAIRRGRDGLHIFLMQTALAVSVLFLACYLYFHFVVLDGQPTRFRGEGWVRPTYFAILLSHTILAMVVAPLALVVTYLGWKNRLRRHVKVARWTLPLWLYVSITGVVVYWILYQMYPPY